MFVIFVVFDCKCKSLKRLGENINKKNIKKHNTKTIKTKKRNSKENRTTNRNTGYPALDPTANKYISGSGWEISVLFLLFVCFPLSVSVVFMCLCVCSIVNAKAKKD